MLGSYLRLSAVQRPRRRWRQSHWRHCHRLPHNRAPTTTPPQGSSIKKLSKRSSGRSSKSNNSRKLSIDRNTSPKASRKRERFTRPLSNTTGNRDCMADGIRSDRRVCNIITCHALAGRHAARSFIEPRHEPNGLPKPAACQDKLCEWSVSKRSTTCRSANSIRRKLVRLLLLNRSPHVCDRSTAMPVSPR